MTTDSSGQQNTPAPKPTTSKPLDFPRATAPTLTTTGTTFLPPGATEPTSDKPPLPPNSPQTPYITAPFVSVFAELYKDSKTPPRRATPEPPRPPSPPWVANWRHLPRSQYSDNDSPDDTDARADPTLSSQEIAASLYNLTPIASSRWDDYLLEREAAEEAFKYVLSQPAFPYTDRHDVLLGVIRDTVEVICSTTDLEDDEPAWKSVADGVTVLLCKASEYPDYSDPREPEYYDDETFTELMADEPEFLCYADVLTRIYSATTPGSVDVRFRYKFDPYPPSKKWNYAIGLRINTRPSPVPLDPAEPLLDDQDIKDNGDLGEFELVCTGEWINDNEVEVPGDTLWKIEKEFYLKRELLDRVHGTLFGKAGDATGFVKRFDLLSTVLFLFASVGVALMISDDEQSTTTDDCFREGPRLYFELGGQPWLAREIRNVCGVPLKRDASFVDPDVGFVSDTLEGVDVIKPAELAAHAQKMRNPVQ